MACPTEHTPWRGRCAKDGAKLTVPKPAQTITSSVFHNSGKENESDATRTSNNLQGEQPFAGSVRGKTVIRKPPQEWDGWTNRQKDEWWRDNVYRGDMPQLTLRAGITGAVVGAILSLVNLYIGIKTGFAIGMGVTSVVLAFIAFGVLSKIGVAKQITLLENNAVQSAATAAGYMTGLITASLPAYMLVTNAVFPLWQAIVWGVALAVLGVLFAFPLKKRFINWHDYPFPEGKAAAVVMDGLHSDRPEERIKVKILAIAGSFAATWQILSDGKVSEWLRAKAFALPAKLLNWLPSINGVKVQDWRVNVTTDMALIGVGGIVGPRVGVSWLLGGVITYFVLVPLLILSDVLPAQGTELAQLNYRGIVAWAMWPGVAMITVASLYPLIAKLDLRKDTVKAAFTRAMAAVRSGRNAREREEDVLKGVELPMWVFWVGIPIVSAIVIALGRAFFGIGIGMGIGAILLIGLFTLIAVNSTALTSFTPVGALAKLSQLYAAVCSPGNAGVNLATGSITADVTSNASNLLMDIKAGYLLGAKPRQQAIAHVIGATAGACAATAMFYRLFNGDLTQFGSERMPLPSMTIWKGLAVALNQGLTAIPVSARWAALTGALVGAAIEWLHARSVSRTKRPFPISAIGLSLGFIVPFDYSATIALGSILFWLAGRIAASEGGILGTIPGGIGRDIRHYAKKGGILDRVIVQDDGGVTLASGLIAGAGIMGIIILCM